MRQVYITSALLAGVIFGVVSAKAAAPQAPEGRCIDDWSVASRIVAQEGLASVERLASAAGKRIGGAIVRTTLCHEGGRYVYRVLVRNRQGEISRHNLDARHPLGF